MNLEQILHQRWADAPELETLLPAERVSTGHGFGRGLPYASLSREKTRPLVATNDGALLEEVTLRIDLWHERFDDARAVARQVVRTFDHTTFPLEGSDRVLRMRRTEETMIQNGESVWHVAMKFTLHVYTNQEN